MHTTKIYDEYYIIHNSDFSGDITLCKMGDDLLIVPYEVFEGVVKTKIASEEIGKLEQHIFELRAKL